jgi:hypothetical protein
MVQATLKFFNDAQALGKLNENFHISGRVDVGKAGPGEEWMKIIRTWPQWKGELK